MELTKNPVNYVLNGKHCEMPKVTSILWLCELKSIDHQNSILLRICIRNQIDEMPVSHGTFLSLISSSVKTISTQTIIQTSLFSNLILKLCSVEDWLQLLWNVSVQTFAMATSQCWLDCMWKIVELCLLIFHAFRCQSWNIQFHLNCLSLWFNFSFILCFLFERKIHFMLCKCKCNWNYIFETMCIIRLLKMWNHQVEKCGIIVCTMNITVNIHLEQYLQNCFANIHFSMFNCCKNVHNAFR